jgi:hypothetical protein
MKKDWHNQLSPIFDLLLRLTLRPWKTYSNMMIGAETGGPQEKART